MLIKNIKIILLLSITLLLTSCSTNNFAYKDTLNEEITHNVYQFNDEISSSVLSINNSIGDITINNSNTNKLKVSIDLIQTKNLKDIDKKLDNLSIKPKINNNIILFEPLYKNNDNLNYWNWIYDELNSNGIKLNFNIEIPNNIKEIRIFNSLGNINLENISTKIYAQTDIGGINGKNINPLDTAIFKVNVASNPKEAIKINFSNIDNVNNILAGAELGKILLNIPNNSVYTHKESDANNLNLKYPFSLQSLEYFKYCNEKSLEPFAPITDKKNQTVITTTLDNNF